MTGLELIAIAGFILESILIPTAIFAYRLYRDDITDKRLQTRADAVVRAAEQIGKVNNWSNEEKKDYAVITLTAGFPKLTKQDADMMVEAAISAVKTVTVINNSQ